MLNSNLKIQLKTYLEKIVQPIGVIASIDDIDKYRELQSIPQEIVLLSERNYTD